MKVSKNSWHYRLINFADFSHPDNLCAYFWVTIFSAIFILFMGFMVIVLTVLGSIPLWWWSTDITMGPAIVVGLIEIIILLFMLHYAIKERHEWEVIDGVREPPQQTLFGAWANAQHRKICPLIDFE